MNTALPNISIDCVIFGYDAEGLKVLLFEETYLIGSRKIHALKLPGDHILQNETLQQSAERVLYEQTGVRNIFIRQFQVFSDPDRLKHGSIDFESIKSQLPDRRVITVGFYSLVNISDIKDPISKRACWINCYEVGRLIFDHNEILDAALERLRKELLHHPIAFELLPEKFSLTQLQKLYEAIFNTEFDKRNFRRKIAKMKYLIPLDEFETGVSHKPARYYSFDREIYETTRRENFDFRL
ncbi:NUDIX hydrolase [Coprobacter tertius]|uniref:NUDIX hydrolase n=1 Tax=Coprobacter tertius TaxID=2944915 RepID=A0ABT1MIR4_9BACT|nr:NUDIX hydrolase [Coprobacter tertius]MCP9612498.1 NUDIX hydrolase [Coprobacter tertius]